MVKNLKKIRDQYGISQEKLAAQTGISARRIYTYESEKENVEPDIQTLSVLADFFGVSIDALVGRQPAFPSRVGQATLTPVLFGKRVREIREGKGISRSELANSIGITPSYLGIIENRSGAPKLETSLKILNALNASADAVFMDCLNYANATKASVLQFKLSDLTPEDQTFILNVLDTMIQSVKTQHQTTAEPLNEHNDNS